MALLPELRHRGRRHRRLLPDLRPGDRPGRRDGDAGGPGLAGAGRARRRRRAPSRPRRREPSPWETSASPGPPARTEAQPQAPPPPATAAAAGRGRLGRPVRERARDDARDPVRMVDRRRRAPRRARRADRALRWPRQPDPADPARRAHRHRGRDILPRRRARASSTCAWRRFAVALVGFGIALDRLGTGGAGIGELLLFLGTAGGRDRGDPPRDRSRPATRIHGAEDAHDPRAPAGRAAPRADGGRVCARRSKRSAASRRTWSSVWPGRCGPSTAATSTLDRCFGISPALPDARARACSPRWVPPRTPARSTSAMAGAPSSRWSRTTTRAPSSPTRARRPASPASCATSSRWGCARWRSSIRCASARSISPPPRCAQPPILFAGVVAGIGGYGNCIGVPDRGWRGAAMDAAYSGNPLVNAMAVGVGRPVRASAVARRHEAWANSARPRWRRHRT